MKHACLLTLGVMVLAVNGTYAQYEQLTLGGGSGPCVSPDGNWVAYTTGGDIWKVPATGGGGSFVAASGSEPDWSPDGNRIVYVDGADGSLRVADPNSGATALVSAAESFSNPAWSPDGTEIAVQGDPSIKFVSFPAGVVSTVPCAPSSQCQGESPDWSADGQTLCFEDGLLIMTLPRTGGSAEVLVDCGNDVAYPVWSPDGRFVAFSRETPDFQDSHIWVVDVSSRALGRVTADPYDDLHPAWSPDGQWIYFSSDRSGSRQIWRVPFSESVPIEAVSWGSAKSLWR